jgi:ParB-like nuclease domain.
MRPPEWIWDLPTETTNISKLVPQKQFAMPDGEIFSFGKMGKDGKTIEVLGAGEKHMVPLDMHFSVLKDPSLIPDIKAGLKDVRDKVNSKEYKRVIDDMLQTKKAEQKAKRLREQEKLLLKDAPNYKSSEDFINAQGKPSTKKLSDIDASTEWDMPDPYNETVNSMVESLRAGKELPPMEISDTGRLYDGRHRLTAYKRAGTTGEVPVKIVEHPRGSVAYTEWEKRLTDLWNKANAKKGSKLLKETK